MKKKITIIACFCFTLSMCFQTIKAQEDISLPADKKIGALLNDTFVYGNQKFSHYSLGWLFDPIANLPGSGYSLWMSAHNGIRLFTGSNPRLTIDRSGKVGIGTVTPTVDLNVVGRIAIAPTGTFSDEGYNGNLVITKPKASGQYINMIRQSSCIWSIGMLYNTNTFCIAGGTAEDSKFNNSHFTIASNGNVGIGTGNPANKLSVNGTIQAKEIKVETFGADFVFEEDYELPSLEEVSDHIKEKKHLPGIPSAKEMQENGVGLGDLNIKLLQKIEELTLYVIQLQNEVKELKSNDKTY